MNTAPTPQEVRMQAEQRYQTSRQRLFNLLAARQQYANELAAKMEADLKKQEAEQAEIEKGQRLNILGDTLGGAQMGAMFGPQGAAIGAGIGGVLGAVDAYGQRKKEGQGTLESILKTGGDLYTGGMAGSIAQATKGEFRKENLGGGMGQYGMIGAMLAPKKVDPAKGEMDLSNPEYRQALNSAYELERANAQAGMPDTYRAKRMAPEAIGTGDFNEYDPSQRFA